MKNDSTKQYPSLRDQDRCSEPGIREGAAPEGSPEGPFRKFLPPLLLLVIALCILYIAGTFLRRSASPGPAADHHGSGSSLLRVPVTAAEGSGHQVRGVIDAAAEAAKPPLLIPDNAVSFGGHHYYIYNDVRTSWEDAAQLCRERGGYLAVINDAEENTFLYGYMLELGYEEAFFGLTDSLREGVWTYLSGDTSEFRDWGRNSRNVAEPNSDDPEENYGQLDTNLHGGCWNDGAFGKRVYTPDGKPYRDLYTYICEWNR